MKWRGKLGQRQSSGHGKLGQRHLSPSSSRCFLALIIVSLKCLFELISDITHWASLGL